MKIIDVLQMSRHMNFCNLTLVIVVRENSEGWMFVSMVSKDYPVLYFEEKLVTKYALVTKKFLAKCEIRPTNHSLAALATILHRPYGYIVIYNIFVQ